MGRVVELLDVDLRSLELDYCTFVIVHISVVWGGEDSDDDRETTLRIPLMHFVSLQLSLVGPDHRQQLVFPEEFGGCFGAEEEGAASHLVCFVKAFSISTVVLDWVRPQQVSEEACSGWLFHSLDVVEVFQRFQVWRDASVYCQELVVDQSADREHIECVHEQVVCLLVVFSQHFDPKIEEGRHLPALMVSPQQQDRLRVVQFQGIYQQNNFDGEGASIHIIPQEQILCVFRIASHIKQFDEVVILAVDVSDYRHRVFELEQVGFLLQNVQCIIENLMAVIL